MIVDAHGGGEMIGATEDEVTVGGLRGGGGLLE